MSARLRLFVALDLPADVRAALAAWCERAAPPGVRRVAEENLHVTLAFLGMREEGEAGVVAALLGLAAAKPLPVLRTAGALWLPPRRPGVLTVALADEPALTALQGDLVGALGDALDWQPERRAFRPHATVGRVRRGDRVRATELDPPAPDLAFRAPAVTLYRSHTGPGGSRYEALARVGLR